MVGFWWVDVGGSTGPRVHVYLIAYFVEMWEKHYKKTMTESYPAILYRTYLNSIRSAMMTSRVRHWPCSPLQTAKSVSKDI